MLSIKYPLYFYPLFYLILFYYFILDCMFSNYFFTKNVIIYNRLLGKHGI